MAHIEAGWPDGTETGPEAPPEQKANGAMLSWLVRGTHKVAIDQRRRFGRHQQSRRLLAADSAKTSNGHGTWEDLVAALQRQAVHGALAQLRKTDRQILTLAYLQGHSNREIANMLGVSVRTVSRRLSAALARLDDHVRQAKIWVTSIAIVALAHVRGARLPGGVSTSAVAAAAVVALGVVAVGPEPHEGRVSTPPPPVTQSIGSVPHAPLVKLTVPAQPVRPVELTSPGPDATDKPGHGRQQGKHGHHSHAGDGA